jgi:hypothetical protein
MRTRTAAAPAGGRGFAAPVYALDSASRFDYEHDPFLMRLDTTCWPDFVIR